MRIVSIIVSVCSLFGASSAFCGTIGIFKIPQADLKETEIQGVVQVPKLQFEELIQNAAKGDVVFVGDSKWQVESISHEASALELMNEELEQAATLVGPVLD